MVEACLRHDWPGNVRALQTAVDQAIENALADDAPSLELAAGALDTRVAAAPPTTTTIAGPSRALSPREQREEDFAHLVETKHGGNVSAAARELGIKTSTGHDMWKRAVARRRGGGDT